MSTEIESLELKIHSDATSAVKGIEALSRSLTTLRKATAGLTGLKTIATNLTALGDAAKHVDPSSANAVEGLAKAIQLFNGVKISTNIAKQIEAINTALKTADFTGSGQKITELVTALTPLSQLPKPNVSTYISNINKLVKALPELDKVDLTAFSKKINDLAVAMKPLADQMQKVSNGFSAFPAKIQKLLTATTKIPAANQKASHSYTELYHKLRLIKGFITTVGSTIYSLIQKSSDYVENVNLFTVAMGEYAGEAKEYAETVSEAMGIDSSDWMRNQGVFMTLATGFGVAGDRAATMSKNLTQLGYDLSSFYNISVEDAMQKIKSGFAGELEPLRAVGYDLSQAKLEATALALGIDKSVSSMTQAEKAQLRYYAIMTQVTTVQGDMARTLESPANQLRVFKAQVNMAAREIGNVFIPALNAILPYAIAVVKIIRILASNIASLFGYEMPDMSGSTGAVVENTDAVQENLEGASEEAKKLKSYMLGFDELNVINPTEGSTGEDGVGEFDFELPDYSEKFLEGLADSKVSVIVEEMKEWLGITEDIDSWADLFDTKLGKILATVGLIGAGFTAWKIGAGVYSAITAIGSALPGISAALGALGTAIGAISAPTLLVIAAVAALVAGLATIYATNEEVRTSVNNAVKDIGESLKPLLEFLTGTVIPNLKSAWKGLVEILTPFGEWLEMVFTSIWEDMIIPALGWLSSTAIPMATEAFMNLWNNVLIPLGEFMGSVLAPVISIVSELLTWLWQYVVVPLADCLGGIFATVWVSIVKIFNDNVIPRLNKVIKVLQFLWNNVLLPIISVLKERFAPIFETVFKAIGERITAFKKIITGLITFITGIFTKDWKHAWNGVVTLFSGIWDMIASKLKLPLNLALANVEGFINAIIEGWNWLKKGINSLSIDVPEWLGGGTIGWNLAMTDKVKLPRFAEGGFPEQGQMFIAREAGAEMVGTIGRRTAVANNDQIVAGIAGGVAEANAEQNVLLREQNALLRAILEKDSGVYLDGKNLTASVEKYQRERGRVLITGGVV